MSHVDDGTLNALLDGELSVEETAAVEAHIAACPECTKRLAEAKGFLAEASELLGVLEVPKPAAEAPARRVPKTAREVALDLDGVTQKSPAIRPYRDGEAPKASALRPPARHRLDFTTLAWAATVVLAIGVGFLANEVRHTRQAVALGEGAAGRPAQAPGPSSAATAQRPAAPAPVENAAAPPASQSTGRDQPGRRAQARSARSGGLPAGAADLTRKETPALTGKQLAAGAPPTQAAAGNVAGRAAKALEVVGGVGRVAERPAAAGVTAETAAAPSADRNALAAAQRGAVPAPSAAAEQRLAGFRAAGLEEAVARLGGTIRLIDGMRIDHVEVGPGSRVPGAARGFDVVRILYVDDRGRRIVLDQQRMTPSADSVAAARDSADVGMTYGDTLTTEAPNGQVRVRWMDRERFWLSLTASLPPDSARALVARVR
jgi:anti-sigma factor RsiW